MTEKTKRRSRTAGVLLILAVLLLVLIWVDINAGYQQITLTQLWQIICGKGEKGVTYTLVNLRLPRVLTSLLVGVGLSAAGCVLQGVSRNEMAEPGILGINAGAGLFIAAYIVLFSGSSVTYSILLPILAFAGSICTAAVDYRSHYKSIDNLPSLAQIAETEDEAALNDFIGNFTKQELIAAWGSPNECSRMEDVWYINENTKLIVNYHNNDDHAVVCSIIAK